MPLIDADCRAVTCPPDRQRQRIHDAGGLYLEVSPNGSKRWFWKYRKQGKEGRLALGSYPTVGLKDARTARESAKTTKAGGFDPVQERKVGKLKALTLGCHTFAVTAREWIALHRPQWSDAHYERELRNLEKDLIPYLGPRTVREIEPVEILAVVRRVEARGALVAARRVLSTARGVFLYAVATSRADRDITPDLKRALKPHTKKNLPAITDPTELAGLLRASDGHKGGPVVRAALALAPLLFQRPGNLRTMRWQDVDMEARLWVIPSEDMKRTKEGKLNGPVHVVPLPKQAIALLQELQPITGGGVYVFPGLRNPNAPMSEAGVSAALNAMGYKGIQTWHGYRATGRTIIREVLKFPEDVIEAQLAHTGEIGHGGAYNRATHLQERKVMVQAWADYLDRLRKGADIITLPKRTKAGDI